jgi:hypothetical protein
VVETSRTVGAFAYFESDPATNPGMVRAALEGILRHVNAPRIDVKMSVYKGRQEGRWRGFKWQAIEEAISDPEVQVLNLVVGAPLDVWFSAKLQLRSSPDPRLRPSSPRTFYFASELRASGVPSLSAAGREMLEQIAGAANPVSGGVLTAPTFNQAYCEVEDSGNSQRASLRPSDGPRPAGSTRSRCWAPSSPAKSPPPTRWRPAPSQSKRSTARC